MMNHESYHIRKRSTTETAVIWSIIILSAFIGMEIFGAIVSNSLALASDAMHLITDVLALCIALFGFWIGKKSPTLKYSYGFMRAEVLAALINALLWFMLFLGIIIESIRRLIYVEPVDPTIMLPIAVLGLIANLIVYYILHRGHDGENINMRGAILHVLLDIIGSVGAIVGGVVIYYTDWFYIDPIISVLLASLILRSGVKLFRDCIDILMESNPDEIDSLTVKNTILSEVDDVMDVHHIHIWKLASGQVAATMHVVILDDGDCNTTIWKVKKVLDKNWGIIHTAVQVEHGKCPDEELFYDKV